MPPRSAESVVACLLPAALLAAGCVVSKASEPRRFDLDSMPQRADSIVSPEVLESLSARIGRRAIVEDLGWLPADTSTMPVVSPAADAVAVQRRPSPSVESRLGRTSGLESTPPAVAIHRLTAAAAGEPARFDGGRVAAEPLLLARAADNAGPMVEGPRADGSRWIGRLRWSDGAIEWLVSDEAINAMPAAGPGGLLAWCRRDRGEGGNSLRLSDATGRRRNWPAEEGHQWILPHFSGDGRHLMALLQGDGRAELIAWPLADLDGPSIVQPLSARVDAALSLAALSGAAVPEGEAAGPGWWMIHPDLRRLVCWLPDSARFDPMPPSSFAWVGPIAGGLALADRDGVWFAAGNDDPEQAGEYRLLIEGSWLPRAIAAAPDQMLLFGVEGAGYRVLRVGLASPASPAAR
jgi:hypothetical protein